MNCDQDCTGQPSYLWTLVRMNQLNLHIHVHWSGRHRSACIFMIRKAQISLYILVHWSGTGQPVYPYTLTRKAQINLHIYVLWSGRYKSACIFMHSDQEGMDKLAYSCTLIRKEQISLHIHVLWSGRHKSACISITLISKAQISLHILVLWSWWHRSACKFMFSDEKGTAKLAGSCTPIRIVQPVSPCTLIRKAQVSLHIHVLLSERHISACIVILWSGRNRSVHIHVL